MAKTSDSIGQSDTSFADRVHNERTAWIILALSIAVTASAYFLADHYVNQRISDRFAFEAQALQLRIEERLEEQFLILKAGVGLVEASESVSREEWRVFVEELNLPKNFPGLLGYGYSLAIKPDKLESHIEAIRQQGFPDYEVKPAGERDFYTAIVFLEPFDWRNQRAFGYDMYSQETRREAMDRAIDSGQMAISGRVTLVQETSEDVQHGFLMYLPVYQKGMPRETVDDRRQNIRAFVYSPFRMGDLMRGILEQEASGIDYAIFDHRFEQNDLMYTSVAGLNNADLKKAVDSADHSRVLNLPLGGRQWQITVYSQPGFSHGSEKNQPVIIAIGGAIIDVLLFWVLLSLARQKRLAQRKGEDIARQAIDTSVRLQSIFDAVEDAVATINEQGIVESAYPAITKLFGYDPKEIIGRNIACLMPDRIAQHHDDYIQNYLRTGEAKIIGTRREVVGRRSDASEFPIELSIQEVELKGKRHFIGVMRDLTEKKRIDSLKNEFISTVSHELRTPLTAISGTLGLLKAGIGGKLEDKGHELLSIAEANSARLRMLIDDILDMEKLDSGGIKMEMLDWELEALIAEATASNEAYVKKFGSRIEVQDIPEVSIKVDRLRFQQVLSNLISNAAKFSPYGAIITLSAELSPPLVPGAPQRVRVGILDQGDGIPEAFRDKLFTRFAQADGSSTRKVGGSGLGLYISRQLVELMKGEIGFEPASEGGTLFYAEFPVCG